MTDDTTHWCVLMPCSKTESWAVPQNSIAEIVTLQATTEQPPEELEWRGQTIPVLDFGFDEDCSWREQLGGTGLIAIFLGLKGEGCDYWGVAVRGVGGPGCQACCRCRCRGRAGVGIAARDCGLQTGRCNLPGT